MQTSKNVMDRVLTKHEFMRKFGDSQFNKHAYIKELLSCADKDQILKEAEDLQIGNKNLYKEIGNYLMKFYDNFLESA